jgi:hypothetical protein
VIEGVVEVTPAQLHVARVGDKALVYSDAGDSLFGTVVGKGRTRIEVSYPSPRRGYKQASRSFKPEDVLLYERQPAAPAADAG